MRDGILCSRDKVSPSTRILGRQKHGTTIQRREGGEETGDDGNKPVFAEGGDEVARFTEMMRRA